MKILVVGGTRFVGKAIVSNLRAKGHEISVFTRGQNPIPDGVEHLLGDRTSLSTMESLRGRKFDVIIDSSGRTLEDSKRVIELTGFPSHRFLYVSSAGVYLSSEELPLTEKSKIDPESRHSGKVDTEKWLDQIGIPFTSFRPTYIYGPDNYNPIETWFFYRITNNYPIPMPDSGKTITQLGHVDDLAEAMVKSLDYDSALNQIYNCSGKGGVTFKGLIEKAAIACNKNPCDMDIRSFDTSNLNPNLRKVFPVRLSHFLTDISLIEKDLDWTPSFDLESGLKNSFVKDYSIKTVNSLDLSIDQKLIGP